MTHDRDHNQSTIFYNNIGLQLHWQTRGQIQSAGPLGRIKEDLQCVSGLDSGIYTSRRACGIYINIPSRVRQTMEKDSFSLRQNL
jgi:hypothetical protein